jgi:hypothetical protein
MPSFPLATPVTSPALAYVECPACRDDEGQPTGEALVQIRSGTWVRRVCEACEGKKVLDAEGIATWRARTAQG